MVYRALFAYAWDIAEQGAGAAAAEFTGLGLNTITLAGSYHAGKFLRPHGATGKVYFPEDGTVTFRTDERRYGALKPQANSLLAEHDMFGALCEGGELDVNAWLVLMHNSRLGERHPEATVQNAFGDRYVYSLCPAGSETRDYARALCCDITENYPVSGISLESPGYLPYVHGYHHEFALMRQNSWLNNLLGLCFCQHCRAGAEGAGIDVAGLQNRVRDWVEGYFAGSCDFAEDMAAAFWQADLVLDPDLAAFLRWRCTIVTSLIEEIRGAVRADATVAVIPSVARPSSGAWYEGSDLAALGRAAGLLEVCFYEPSPGRIGADIRDVQRRVGANTRLRGVLRPGYPDLEGPRQVAEGVAALAAAGIEDIAFYNYGHLRRANLQWMAAALEQLDRAG